MLNYFHKRSYKDLANLTSPALAPPPGPASWASPLLWQSLLKKLTWKKRRNHKGSNFFTSCWTWHLSDCVAAAAAAATAAAAAIWKLSGPPGQSSGCNVNWQPSILSSFFPFLSSFFLPFFHLLLFQNLFFLASDRCMIKSSSKLTAIMILKL